MGEKTKDSYHINYPSAYKMEDIETGIMQCLESSHLSQKILTETLFGLEGWKRKKAGEMQLGGGSTS